ncbi:MAG: redoxin domain-containing protein [Alistipes sp.]|nr:redoxin domain-containing protein [Alistipes sp.]
MKYLRLFIAIIAVTLFEGCVKDEHSSHDESTLVRTGQIAPDFSVELLDGREINLSDLRGRTVMLIFLSTSCTDCHAQFEDIARRCKEQSVPFEILAISRGESREATLEFANNYGLECDLGIDPDKSIYGMYATMYVPRVFLIGSEGYIKGLTVEYSPAEFDSLWQKALQLVR